MKSKGERWKGTGDSTSFSFGALLAALTALVAYMAVAQGFVPVAQGFSLANSPNLLLITLDTVRADRIGAYGHKGAATPVLDRLAAEGIRFADATTHSPLTGPAHAAILTGIYPGRFGVRDNASTPLPADATTLAELLRGAGYRTAAFIGAFILDRAYGFDQGFEEFDSRFERYALDQKLHAQRRGGDIADAALAWIERAPSDRPFFAWVHLFDAHTPYAPPAPFAAKFKTRLYDGEIAYVDAQIGRLVQTLERRGILDRTLVMAIGDHGESLGEHGESEHGVFLYDSVLRIPWIVRLPARAHAGRVVDEQVRAIDLVPTTLDVIGLAPPKDMDGGSLKSVIEGRARRDPPLSYAESFYPRWHFGYAELRSVRAPEWKFVAAPTPELYDLRNDRAEASNVIATRATVGARLQAELGKIAASFGASDDAPAQPDPETLARLRSLGYVGLAAPGGSPHGLADPKDKIKELESFRPLVTRAIDHLKARRPDAAIAALKRLLPLNERSYELHLLLGDAYTQKADAERALGEYAAAATLNPSSAAPLLAAAEVELGRGALKEAERQIERAAALEPLAHEVPLLRGRLHERRGDAGEAFAAYQRSVQMNPSDPRPRALLANVSMAIGMLDVARDEFQVLFEMGHQPARSLYGLGQIAEARGDRKAAIGLYQKALQLNPALAVARKRLEALK